jgi:hypothetical protein
MLVYLDHAHIVALERLMKRTPGEFARFLERWLGWGCHMVVSRAHLHEIGQGEDERDVESKLEMLRYFSLWSAPEDENVDWVIIREIRHQTLTRLSSQPDPAQLAYGAVRDEMFRPVDQERIGNFVRRSRAGWLEELRSRRGMAEFENRSLALRRLHQEKLKKKPKWDPNGWKRVPRAQAMLPRLRGDAVSDRWMDEVAARTQECWRRAKRERQAKICIYGVEGMAELDRVPLEDLSRLGFYRALGRHWIAPYCERANFTAAAVREALDRFDPYDAPAISAALAVERGRKRHEKGFEASDFMDVDHVLWAAYTDMAFVDKRTYGFLAQARKDRKTADLLSPHLRVRFEQAATLDDVERRIASFAEDRSAAPVER